MSKILVLYYSAYGHTLKMAEAVAEGAREGGADVTIRRVAELDANDDDDQDKPHPIATVDELPDYDGIVFGTPTRYGRMSASMAAFLDRTGGLWAKGALNGKVGASFTSTATQHGGQEMTHFSMITNLLHFGMTIVGLDYGFQQQMTLDEVIGGSPYGASTIAGGKGERQPSDGDLAGARYLGKRVAETATKLAA